MIQESFKKNWKEILNFNLGIQDEEDLKKAEVLVRIPTTPIEIDASLLYKLVSNIYPDFVNDKENVLDIIISDDGKSIKAIYAHITHSNGNHLQAIDINKNIYAFQQKDLDDFENFFEKIQIVLREKERIIVSGIRVYKAKAIELINGLSKNLETQDLVTNFNRLCSVYFDILRDDLFFIYPEPPFMVYLKKVVKFSNFVESTKIFDSIYSFLSNFKISLTFAKENLLFSLLIEKSIDESKNDEEISKKRHIFSIKIINNENSDYNFSDLNPKSFLKQFSKQCNTNYSYFINFDDFLSYIADLFESDFPFDQDRLSLLIQKILYAYKSYDIKWFSYPTPISYNFFVRFFSRLVGFNINLKKISYWAIPGFFTSAQNSIMGLYNKILVIFTDKTLIQKDDEESQDFLTESYISAYLIEFLNGKIIFIQKLDKENVLKEDQFNTLQEIRERLSEKFGYLSYVISIDKTLISLIINNFILNLNRFNPFAKLMTLRKLKNRRYLNFYPQSSVPQKVKVRKLLPILIDKHEF